MLARKYDEYAWQQPLPQEFEQPAAKPKRVPKVDKYASFRTQSAVVIGMVAALYLVKVMVMGSFVTQGNILVNLQQQEARLITQTNELKIEVEQLKGPERIIGLAEQQLGMKVARSNIYVKAAGTK